MINKLAPRCTFENYYFSFIWTEGENSALTLPEPLATGGSVGSPLLFYCRCSRLLAVAIGTPKPGTLPRARVLPCREMLAPISSFSSSRGAVPAQSSDLAGRRSFSSFFWVRNLAWLGLTICSTEIQIHLLKSEN
jgi:hypothetical protein